MSPDFSKDFQIFYFASEDTIASVLLQRDDDNKENPIAFMSNPLRDAELKYAIMEKQAYALVQSLKHFRSYVGYSRIVAYVPHTAVKNILTHQDCLSFIGKWVTQIKEYDIEIRPTKLIKGQRLAQMLTGVNEKVLGLGEASPQMISAVLDTLEQHEWYSDIIYYLKNLSCPNHLVYYRRRALRLKASKYCITQGGLGWNNPDGLVLRCVDDIEAK